MSSVDVIVPCYRYGRFLRECVQSILIESQTDVRVLIIDDASPDNTAEVAADLVREDSRVVFLRHAQNRGHIATYNEGIEWASANYLLVLSADDYLTPGALGRAAGLLDSHPEVGFAFGKAIELWGSATISREETVHSGKVCWEIVDGVEFIERNGAGNIVPAPSAVIRTELQKRVGGYRAELPHSGDMEMWLRLAAHASVGILDTYQAVYRRHGDNMSVSYYSENSLRDIEQRKAALDCLFERCGGQIPNLQELHRKLYWLLACDAVGLASTAFNADRMAAVDQLCELAARMSPEIKTSRRWIKLAWKRRLGYATWHTVQPAVAWARKAASVVKLMS